MGKTCGSTLLLVLCGVFMVSLPLSLVSVLMGLTLLLATLGFLHVVYEEK